jgi:hypothetical protein
MRSGQQAAEKFANRQPFEIKVGKFVNHRWLAFIQKLVFQLSF